MVALLSAAKVDQTMITYLDENDGLHKSFVVLKWPERKPTPVKLLHGDSVQDNVYTFTPIGEEESEPDHTQLETFVTRIDRPAEYSIAGVLPEKAFLYGVFTPASGEEENSSNSFVMALYAKQKGGISQPVELTHKDSYRWERMTKHMISTTRSDASPTKLLTNPEIRDRCDLLQQDVQTVLPEDKRATKNMMKYIVVLYEAMVKFLSTDKDKDVFYNIIGRRNFKMVERKLRKSLWDYDDTILHSLAALVDRNVRGLSGLAPTYERSALQDTLKVLQDYLLHLHPQIHQDVRLDDRYIVNDVKAYVTLLVKTSSPELDPITPLFAALQQSFRATKDKPVSDTVTDLFERAEIKDSEQVLKDFKKDVPPAEFKDIVVGLTSLVGRIGPFDESVTRALKYLLTVLKHPATSVVGLVTKLTAPEKLFGPAWWQNSRWQSSQSQAATRPDSPRCVGHNTRNKQE